MKQQPCCARRTSKLRMDQQDLARIARRAARYPESPRWKDAIAKQKKVIAMDKQAIIDHEAEHAGEAAA